MITSVDSNSNPIYDSSVDVSGYTLYFPTSTIDNGDGTTSTSYTLYPTLSNGTNTITYDSSNFNISSKFYRSYSYKRFGKQEKTTEIKFVIGGEYATEHSSTSYNIFSIKLYGVDGQTVTYHGDMQQIVLSYITRLQEKFVNNYTPPMYKYYISYNSIIGRSILHIYDRYNIRLISTSYNTGVIIPTITELYSI